MEADQAINEISKEKQHFMLIREYRKAVDLLKKEESRSQGKTQIQKILTSEYIDDPDIQELKFSVLLSLAQVNKIEENIVDALYYFYQSTKIKETFNTWLKIAQNLQKLPQNYIVESQIHMAYKHAIKLSPEIWKNRLLTKLLSLYEKHGRTLEAADLRAIIDKNIKINYSQQNQKKNYEQKMKQVQIRRLKIKIPTEYQNWEFLLAVYYFLLKCRCERNFLVKKQMKKHEKVLKELQEGLSMSTTSISFQFQKAKSSMENEEEEKEKEKEKEKDSEMIDEKEQAEEGMNLTQIILDILKQSNKGKGKKVQKGKKDESGSCSKNMTKNINYECLQNFYKENCNKFNFNLQDLEIFQYLDPSPNQLWYSGILKPLTDYSKKQNSHDKDEQILNRDRSLAKYQRIQNQNITKEVKSKKENNDNDENAKNDFKEFFQGENMKDFRNCLILGETIFKHLLNLVGPWGNLKIAKWMNKCMIKLLQLSQGFLSFKKKEDRVTLNELLYQHLQQISQKNPANAKFRDYQIEKSRMIRNFIIENGNVKDQIYSLTQKYRQNPSFIVGKQQCLYILKQCLCIIKISTLPHLRDEKTVNYYTKIYFAYEEIYKKNEEIQIILNQEGLRQFIEKRINKAKLKESSTLAGESEEKSLKLLDELLKSDTEFSETAESICKLIMEDCSLGFCLGSFIKIIELLFKKLSIDQCYFSSRLITSTFKTLTIPQIIIQVHKKLSKNRQAQIPDEICSKMLYYLIKIYLLGQLEGQALNVTVRIIFFLINSALKNFNEDLKNQKFGEIVIVLDNLLKMTDSFEIRRKLYQRIIIKNINYIYGKNCPKNEKLFPVFSDIYYKKQIFKPKKIEDAIGFFMMARVQYAADLQQEQVQFDLKVKKVFNECYQMFKKNFNQLHVYCENFKNFINDFIAIMKDKKEETENFVSICQSKEKICDCCNVKFPSQILFVIAKFLETVSQEKPIKENEQPTEENKQEQGELEGEEKYYMDYLALNLQCDQAWEEFARLQCFKAYLHFDSYISPQPKEYLAYKFKYVKRMITFIVRHLPHMKATNLISQSRIGILNALKMRQRKLNMDISVIENSSQKTILTKKYQEGLSLILNRIKKESKSQSLIQQKYMNLVEHKLPAMYHHFIQNSNFKLQDFTLADLADEYLSFIYEIKESKAMSDRPIDHLQGNLLIVFFCFVTSIIFACLKELTKNVTNVSQIQNEEEFLLKLTALEEINALLDSLFSNELLKFSEQIIAENNVICFPEKSQYIDFIGLLTEIESKLFRISIIFKNYSSNIKIKKDFYRRSVILSILWFSKIHLYYGDLTVANESIKDCYNLKDEEIIYYYHHYEKESTQRNPLIAEFYNRTIVYYAIKMEFLEHLIEIFQKNKNLQNMVIFIRKLIRIYVFKSDSPEEKKVKATKENKEEEKKQKVEQKPEQKSEQKPEKKEGQEKQEVTQTKPKKQKQEKVVKIEKKNRIMFVMFMKAYDAYLDTIQAMDQELEEKIEKTILEFRNKLRREIEKEKKSQSNQLRVGQKEYGEKIVQKAEKLIKMYQTKYSKQLKLKANKKPKKNEEAQQEKEGNEGKEKDQGKDEIKDEGKDQIKDSGKDEGKDEEGDGPQVKEENEIDE